MASLIYLWKHRAKPKMFSNAFFKAWGKRIFSFPELYNRNRIRNLLVKKGSSIAYTAEVGSVIAHGKMNLLSIGSHSFIGDSVELALHDRIQIGDFVCINDGSKLLSATHDLQDPLWQHIKKPIIIEDYAWIATNSLILPGVHIGKGAVVGAGAVVSKDVPAYGIVAGNPAQIMKKKRTENLRYNPCEFLAANAAWLKG